MKIKEIIIGIIAVALVAGGVIVLKNKKAAQTPKVPANLPAVEEKIEKTFNLTIPEDVDKIELAAVSEIEGSGIATRKYETAKFTHMVLADLPDPEAGSFYAGWLVKDNTFLATGKLRIAKGGYLLEFVYPTDLSSYKKVIVSLENVLGKKPSKLVLEGSFGN